MRLDFFVKLKKWPSTTILSGGIKYSLCDVLFDVNNYICLTYKVAMMSALPLASARLSKLWISFLNRLLDADLCKNFFDFHIIFLLVFIHDFVKYIDFTYVAASNTATDNITY